jgi:hypothetical protein
MESSKWTNDTPNKRKHFNMKTVYIQVRDEVRKQVFYRVEEQIHTQLQNQVRDEVRKQVFNRVEEQIHTQLQNQVRRQVYGKKNPTQLPNKTYGISK